MRSPSTAAGSWLHTGGDHVGKQTGHVHRDVDHLQGGGRRDAARRVEVDEDSQGASLPGGILGQTAGVARSGGQDVDPGEGDKAPVEQGGLGLGEDPGETSAKLYLWCQKLAANSLLRSVLGSPRTLLAAS